MQTKISLDLVMTIVLNFSFALIYCCICFLLTEYWDYKE